MNTDFPFHIDGRGLTATTDDEDHTRDMLEQLIFTNPGERLNRPDFGSGVLQMVFAPNSPELAATLEYTMKAAIQHWLGDVLAIQELVVNSVDSRLTIEIKYLVLRTNQTQTATLTRTV